MTKSDLQTVNILNNMDKYFMQEDNGFHISPSLAYCRSCNAITLVSGNYYRHVGNDCLGSHHEETKNHEKCGTCKDEKNYIKFSLHDINKLKSYISPKTLIVAIDNGLKEMKFPSLYNPDLPKVIKTWRELSNKEKVSEIVQLYSICKELSNLKGKTEKLEKVLA